MGSVTRGPERSGPLTFELRYDDTPPSLNQLGSGNRYAYAKFKKRWGKILSDLLLVAGVPRNQMRVKATATLYFRMNRRRDEGNWRVILEKCLGDSLTAAGIIPDDTHDHFRFGVVRFEQGDHDHTVLRLAVWPD